MEQYDKQKGANFFVCIVNSKEYPLSPGYIKIRKKQFKIGVKKKTLFRIPWKSSPVVFHSPLNNSLLLLEWTMAATCSADKEPSVAILCEKPSHRSLISKTLNHFHRNYYKEK